MSSSTYLDNFLVGGWVGGGGLGWLVDVVAVLVSSIRVVGGVVTVGGILWGSFVG